MSTWHGGRLPYPEFRRRYPAQSTKPVVWQWATLAAELDAAEHGERGTFALARPDGSAEIIPGAAVAFQVVPPGGHTTAHKHSWWHLYFVRSGAGAAVFGEPAEVVELNTGDIVLIPAWATHRFENRTGQDLVLVNVLNIPQQASLGNLHVEEKVEEKKESVNAAV